MERRTAFVSAFCLLVCLRARVEAGGDSRLPDGTEFTFWEKPLSFTRTYYVDGGSPRSDDGGPGTLERPFRTIGKAAEILQPGERVVIAGGTYRECIRPARGGSAPDRMISYEAAPGAAVVVKASEVLRDGWQPSADPVPGSGPGAVRIWSHALSGALFPDAYNPFGLANVPGDWAWLDTKRVDMGTYFRRRGMIFVDGRPLEPVEQYRELGDVPLPGTPPVPAPPPNGLPARTRGGPILQEIGGSPDARFWVEHQGNVVHVRVPAGDPARSVVEITAREQAFAPRQSGLGYIRIKGLTFEHGGNGFPPPQRGLVSTAGGHHWIIEGNTIEWASGVALDIGAQHWRGARDPLAGASHVVRGNTIRYAGVEGIAGMGTTNTLVEDNLVEWVGWQDAERAWEAAGAKFHRARNLLFRRNVVRHIRHANALWLDSGNANSRITANVFADVLTVSAAIHMEMNREANQIDDNLVWDVRNAEPGTPGQRGAAGSGIFLHASERQIVAQNLVGRCDNAGVFPALRPERANAGNGRGHVVRNNVFARCDKGGIVFAHEDNQADGNLYAALPERFGGLGEGDGVRWLDVAAWRAHGWDSRGSTAELEIGFDPDRLELTIASPSAWPTLPGIDGIDTDLAGRDTGTQRPPGPLADPGATRVRSVDPRRAPAALLATAVRRAESLPPVPAVPGPGEPMVIATGPFAPDDASLAQYRYPDWFRDAKLGFWAHWGPQSVPMFGDWYARNMYKQGHKQYQDHLERYGHPTRSGWKDVIPLWKAEKWNPDDLMALYKKAGARYFVSMGVHHDNFDLWDSRYHRWNAVQMGPHRDVVGDWQKAARAHGLPFGVSEHLGASFAWWQGSHGADETGPLAGVPYDGADPLWRDLYHPPAAPGDTAQWYSTDPAWQREWFARIQDLVDHYQPDLLYTDGGVPFGNEVGRNLIAHLYNRSAARHGGSPQVVYTCKQDSNGRWVQDVERGVLKGISPYPWQTDTSIGDWFYNREWKYRPVEWVIRMLVDVVSKNGNLLINVVQRPDGTLDPEVERMLGEMADWIAINGEAIYGTRPWTTYGEGPVRPEGGAFKEDAAFTAEDVRFTTKGDTLYAFVLGWPRDSLTIRALGSSAGRVGAVRLLGHPGALKWTQDESGLRIFLPEHPPSRYAVAFAIGGVVASSRR